MYDYKVLWRICCAHQRKAEGWKGTATGRIAETWRKHQIWTISSVSVSFPLYFCLYVHVGVDRTKGEMSRWQTILFDQLNKHIMAFAYVILLQRDPWGIKIIFGDELSLEVTPISSKVCIINNKIDGHMIQVIRPSWEGAAPTGHNTRASVFRKIRKSTKGWFPPTTTTGSACSWCSAATIPAHCWRWSARPAGF